MSIFPVPGIFSNSGGRADGVKKKTDPGDPVSEDICRMSSSARNSFGIRSLPGSLEESLEALKSDFGYLKSCFHDELLETYVALKQTEVAGGRSRRQQFMLTMTYEMHILVKGSRR